MPKATLEFNLPEETQEHEYACNGQAMYAVLMDIQETLRDARKHGTPEESARAAWALGIFYEAVDGLPFEF